MRIPVRYAPLLFSALLSAIMVSIVSAFVLISTQGLHAGLPLAWLRSFVTTWPVAFPTVALVAPRVRAFVSRVTAQEHEGTPKHEGTRKQSGGHEGT